MSTVQPVGGWLVVAVLAVPAASAAQQPAPTLQIAQPPRQSKVFVDVALFGVADSLAHERAFTVPFRLFGENASMGADYPAPGKATGFPIDIAGGWMFTRLLGAGAAVSRTTYEHSVGLSATIPHPFYFNRPASASGPNGAALSARERAVHTFVTFAPLRRDRMELRVVGGPSFFWYSANMVENVLYTQSYGETTPSNSIAITGSATRDVSGSGIGYHVGGDFTYFVHRVMGLGVAVRYSQGTVRLAPEPLSRLNQDFRVGSTLVALTVRIRVDRAFKH